MSNTKNTPKVTLQDLQNLRTELEAKAVKIQTELADRKYSIDFEVISNLTKVINHINKDVSWTSKNAALLVNLSDSLKAEKSRLLLAETTAKAERRLPDAVVVNLRQVDVNTLYQSLLAVQSTGVEAARTYVKLLTNIGAQITEAMKQMAESNQEIQSLHVELAELDAKIMQEGTPTEPELISNEAV